MFTMAGSRPSLFEFSSGRCGGRLELGKMLELLGIRQFASWGICFFKCDSSGREVPVAAKVKDGAGWDGSGWGVKFCGRVFLRQPPTLLHGFGLVIESS